MKENNSFQESSDKISISEKDRLVQSVLEKGALDKPTLIQKIGLSPSALDESIKNLMKIYPCHLEIDENQNLVYYFDFENPYHKPKKSWDKAKKLAIQLFKVSMFFLPIYFLSPIIILYAYISVTQGGLLAGFIIGGIIFFLFAMVNALVWYYLISPIRDFFIVYYNPRHYHTPKYAFIEGQPVPDDIPDTLNMIQAINDFVFGTKRGKPHLEIERRILNYLSLNDYKFNISELISITGWSREKAEQEACYFVAIYDGEFEINDKNFIVYHFPDLYTNVKEKQKPTTAIWDKRVELLRWNDNPRWMNVLIFFVHYFIFFSCILLFLFGKVLPSWFAVPFIPLIYATTFFTIFILGKQKMLNKNQDILFENDYHKFIERIFRNPEGVFLPKDELTERAVKELEGETAIDANGELYYHFPQLVLELKS